MDMPLAKETKLSENAPREVRKTDFKKLGPSAIKERRLRLRDTIYETRLVVKPKKESLNEIWRLSSGR